MTGGPTVGLITTWHSKCGVAEYSRDLATALEGSGCRVAVLASNVVNPVAWKETASPACRFFHTGWHAHRGVDVEAALSAMKTLGVNVLHLQYQSFIYPPPFLDCLGTLAGVAPVVATFHDPCIPPEFPMNLLETAIVHNRALQAMISGVETTVIAPGYHVLPEEGRDEAREKLGVGPGPVISSFGLGRAAHEEVVDALSGLIPRYPDLTYAIAAPAERMFSVRQAAASCGMDGHLLYAGDFLEPQLLFCLLAAADVVVLYYPEFGVRGVSSAAARLAIASRRPVVLTDVGLFEDLPPGLKVRYGDPRELRKRIVTLLEDPVEAGAALAIQNCLVDANTWAEVARRHVQVYSRAMRRK